MKKKLLFSGLCAVSMLALGACSLGGGNSSSDGSTASPDEGIQHTYVEHEAVSPTCKAEGNKKYYT